MVILLSIFWGIFILFTIQLYHFTFSPTIHKSSNFSTSLLTLVFWFLDNDHQNTQKGKILPRCHLCVETTNNVPRYTRPQEKKPAKPTKKCVFYQRKRIQNKNSSMRMKNTEHFHQFSQCSLLFFSLLHFIS